MSVQNSPGRSREDDRYHGFSLKSVCWGYRDIFARTIEGLFAESVLGPQRREVTAKFFELMKQADQSCFDHVLKEFLGAMNPRTRWLMDLPGIFSDILDLGRRLAASKVHHGIRYFQCLGAGGFGETPRQVRDLLTYLRRLGEIDEDLAIAFLQGYRHLIGRMTPLEIELYVSTGLDVFARSRKNGLAFMAATLRTSENYIAAITQECRLSDVQAVLTGMLKALTGQEFEVCDLGRLDSDDLIERGSTVVCLYRWLYLPARVRHFDDAALNRSWYLLTCVAAAALHASNSFCRIHGHPSYATCRDVVGDDALRLNLFQIVEYVRVLRWARRRWPGMRRLVDFGLRMEMEENPPGNAAEQLLRDAVTADAPANAAVRALTRQADESVNLFDAARRLGGEWTAGVLQAYPGLDRCRLRPVSFLPDFLFPGQVSPPPSDRLVADLKRAAGTRRRGSEGASAGKVGWRATDGADGDAAEQEGRKAQPVEAAHVYDEWSQEENDYYRDYCSVYEKRPDPMPGARIPADIAEQARRVSRVFERFKPDLTRRQKRLREGDSINPDLLLAYLVRRHKEPSPKVDFYERPQIRRRDLAVLILLDTSGSTGEEAGQNAKVIDIEKHAAVILAQGLALLDDRFAVCGFSSNGRENCAYFVYKDFDEPWERQTIARVLAAHPSSSTRIGPALRHSGFRLGRIEARQRLIILVTDGKPMDSGYDPNTRYAQHDVRMACEENARRCIDTFGISTEDNSLADMEIMFPRRRFAILSDIRLLPRILPKLYIRLTA